ncbi:MAG: Holliday junction resolvase [Thermoplasmata archaeon]|mgnify:CR=1 FL=1|nr:MAG: Holliday junction resolvase [Thermoplasmata archaeon]HEC89166.1 Holliday junction resolvase [Thermoplasmatales archaeon]
MNSSQYERELKGILEGEKKVLTQVTKSCNLIEKENYLSIMKKPFAVIRAAGSFGVDLVAVRGDISMLIEIKTSADDTLHFSSMNGKLQQQAESMRILCEKTGTLPLYAFRLKNYRGDCWRIFTFDVSNLTGRVKILHNHLPVLEKSKTGNYIMRWHQGMPLSNLLAYLSQ